MEQYGLNDAHLDTTQSSVAATGITGRTYLSVPTPLRNALEIYGYAWRAYAIVLPALAGASSNAMDLVDGYFAGTYTQPQPPAANATTDAVTTGNLLFRNEYLTEYYLTALGISQPATQGAEVGTNSFRSQGFKRFQKPLRLALSQLEIYNNLQTLLNATSLTWRLQMDVFYKFVQVSDAEYNALVALATGQAVLSEIIVP